MRRNAVSGALICVVLAVVPGAADAAQETGSVHVALRLEDLTSHVRQSVPFPVLMLSIEKIGEVIEPVRTSTSRLGTADVQLAPGTYLLKSQRQLPFERKYYQWTRTIDVRAGETTAVELTIDNAVVQQIPPAVAVTPAPRAAPLRGIVSPTVAVEGGFHAATGWGGRAALLLPTSRASHEDGLVGFTGFELSARAGSDGWQIGGGRFFAGAPFWSDIQATLMRTFETPRKGSSRSTYVGGEVGIAAFPVGMLHHQFLMARPTLGLLRRVAGPSGPGATIFTWGIHIDTWLWFRER